MKSLQYGWGEEDSAQAFAAGHATNTVWLQRGLCGNNTGAALQQRGWGHLCHHPTHSNVPKCSMPHAHQSVAIQGCSTRPCCSPAPTEQWHQQRAAEQILWTSPLLHQPLPKAEDTDREPTALPLSMLTSHTQPWERLFSSCHFCPALQPFPLVTQAKGATPPARAPVPATKKRVCLVGDSGRKALGRARSGPAGWCGSCWGPRERNCGVREWG